MTAPAASRLLVVEWLDSHQPDGWAWLDARTVYARPAIRSVGWLVEQPDRGWLVLAPTLSRPDEDGERQALGLLRIPSCSVTDRWEIADPAVAPRPPRPDSLEYPETKVG